MQIRRHRIILLAGALALLPVTSWAQWRTPWSYEGEKGPDHWAQLDSDYAACATGRKQSPIDIRQTRKARLPGLHFAYKSGPINIINNGYVAVRVDYKPGNGNILTVGDKRYELTQFHFHHPGEEKINGKSADMVLHLMHQASDGEIVGVAVPLMRGKANATVAQLWEHMPQSAGSYHVVPGVSLDPTGMLPEKTGYYRYDGSVSAPPCNEPVTWFVLKTPVEISADEIAAFAKFYPHDVRPIQPMNGRIVQESE